MDYNYPGAKYNLIPEEDTKAEEEELGIENLDLEKEALREKIEKMEKTVEVQDRLIKKMMKQLKTTKVMGDFTA